MAAPEPRVVHVAIAVIERRGRVLICRRRAGDSFGGRWEFPGGKRRRGESWTACLRRELREELGVRVRRVTPLGQLYHRLGPREAFFRVFRCSLHRGTPKPLAAQALRWVAAGRLRRYRFPPANDPLLRQLALKR
jgi:mutator protein MutT